MGVDGWWFYGSEGYSLGLRFIWGMGGGVFLGFVIGG